MAIPETYDYLRISVFLGVLLLAGLWETVLPRRPPTGDLLKRRLRNVGTLVLGTVLVRIFVTVTLMDTAEAVAASGQGILNTPAIPPWAGAILGLMALDFTIYLQHLLFHRVPLLWRLHVVHHTDTHLDFSTGMRFHPLEILLSTLVKFGCVLLFGPPAMAVGAFEIILNGVAIFNHGNLAIPTGVDRYLRLFVVTPDMHRVHHSIHMGETNSNFGSTFPWWDKVLGTYRAQPIDGHLAMKIGLRPFRDPNIQTLWWLLRLPFKRAKAHTNL